MGEREVPGLMDVAELLDVPRDVERSNFDDPPRSREADRPRVSAVTIGTGGGAGAAAAAVAGYSYAC